MPQKVQPIIYLPPVDHQLKLENVSMWLCIDFCNRPSLTLYPGCSDFVSGSLWNCIGSLWLCIRGSLWICIRVAMALYTGRSDFVSWSLWLCIRGSLWLCIRGSLWLCIQVALALYPGCYGFVYGSLWLCIRVALALYPGHSDLKLTDPGRWVLKYEFSHQKMTF